MPRVSSGKNGATTALVAGILLLVWSAVSYAAPPYLGADCGAGATIVGTDIAGKVTLGKSPVTCTLTFVGSYSNAPACAATNETNGGGHAVSVGVRTTAATLVMDGIHPWLPGDVISYLCVSY